MTDNWFNKAILLRRWLLGLPRASKRLFLVVSDLLLLGGTLIGVVWLRRLGLTEITAYSYLLMAVAPLIAVTTFAWFGLYRIVTRYIGDRGNMRVAGGVALSTLIWALLVFMTGQQGIPRSSIVLFWLIGTGVIIASRHFAAYLLRSAGVSLPKFKSDRKRVLIYGAGQAGVRLLEAVRSDTDRDVVGFVDPESSLWGQYVGGLKVYRPDKIVALIERREVSEVLLTLPSVQRAERRAVLELLKGQPVVVKVLPALEDIASGRVNVTDLRAIDVDDLLGRDPVPPRADLLSRIITQKAILVTGAGGSVGSELVRQILKQNPATLVLLDLSELALYQIEMEVREQTVAHGRGRTGPSIIAVLGSVADEALVTETLLRYKIETVFHAAAYKHVPIVEANPITGLHNNVFGTSVLARCAEVAGVERVVLISTDKAVRPTNVMGASKRLAELILQARAANPACRTVFTMVRFGNVLDSSGSVVGLFRRQIRAGGPVTVTHPDVIRYFMSIPEAATLVIQAGAMAVGGEVFVLEMGEPVKIDDLARMMVRLSGLEVRSPSKPDGDIAITYSGLRPGEKLFEELLIGAHTERTEHPRILRSGEPFLPEVDLQRELELLVAAMKLRDVATIQAVLQRTVEGYRPECPSTASTVLPASFPAQSRAIH